MKMMQSRFLRSISLASVSIIMISFLAATANAATIVLSDESSDPTPPPSSFDATFDIQILLGVQLELKVTNTTSDPNLFNINAVYFNASSVVSGLTLVSATHSDTSNVTTAWPLMTDEMADGFGDFDFSLNDGVGETNPDLIQPLSFITFLLDISGSCEVAENCLDTDFVSANDDDYLAAAKFVNGPDDASGFGATPATPIPEPGTALLVGLGLAALSRRATGRRAS